MKKDLLSMCALGRVLLGAVGEFGGWSGAHLSIASSLG